LEILNRSGQNYTIQPAKNHQITSPAPAELILYRVMWMHVQHAARQEVSPAMTKSVNSPAGRASLNQTLNKTPVIAAGYYSNLSGMKNAFHLITVK
jgi:hypothetical protein